VTRVTIVVTTAQVVNAAIAVQKVCASSLGKTWSTPKYPPLTPGTAPAGSVLYREAPLGPVAPPRQAGQVVVDEGDGGVKIAEFLASRKLV